MATTGACLGAGGVSWADPVTVGNYSFETPDITFADSFDHNPPSTSATPWGFTETGGGQVGAFDNTADGMPDHIDNAIGNQVAFLLIGPGVTLFQDITSTGGTFDLGKKYVLTIAAGASSNMPADGQIVVRFYYRDTANNKVTVGSPAAYTFDLALNPGYITHLYDYSVTSPTVLAGDAWRGKNIGIEIAVPGTPQTNFTYWDIDNVRLEAVPEPGSLLLLLGGAIGLIQRPRRRA